MAFGLKGGLRTGIKIVGAAAAIVVIAAGGWIADAHIRIAREETNLADTGAMGHFMTVDGRKIHIQVIGSPAESATPPLLLLHDADVAGGETWFPFAINFIADRAVIVPDMLGFGHSERVTAPGEYYTLKSRAAAIAAALDDAGVMQTDIVAEGYGGAVAVQFAADFPSRVRRMVLMDAVLAPATERNAILLPVIGRAVAWNYYSGGPRSPAAKSCDATQDCRALALARVAGTVNALRAMARVHDDATPALPAVRARTLVIWGGEDGAHPPREGDRLAQALKTNITIIAGAGHRPYVDQPDKVAARIIDFLTAPDEP